MSIDYLDIIMNTIKILFNNKTNNIVTLTHKENWASLFLQLKKVLHKMF